MLKYQLGQKFILNQDFNMRTYNGNGDEDFVMANKNSEMEIIQIDNMDNEFPYQTFFTDCEEWVYLSEEELEELILYQL